MKYEYRGLEQLKEDLLMMDMSKSLKRGVSVEYWISMSITDRNKFIAELTDTPYAFRTTLLPSHLMMDRVIGPNGIIVNFKTATDEED